MRNESLVLASHSRRPSCSKALKVVELKDILAKAQVTITGKANKADLIQKILASPDALAIAQGPSDPVPEQNTAPATQPEPVSLPSHCGLSQG